MLVLMMSMSDRNNKSNSASQPTDEDWRADEMKQVRVSVRAHPFTLGDGVILEKSPSLSLILSCSSLNRSRGCDAAQQLAGTVHKVFNHQQVFGVCRHHPSKVIQYQSGLHSVNTGKRVVAQNYRLTETTISRVPAQISTTVTTTTQS